MMVFHSQLEAVDRATPRLRMGSGKISPMTIQAPGPQVEAKKKMNRAMKAIWALTAECLSASDAGLAGSGPGTRWVWLKPTVTPMMAHEELADQHAEGAPDQDGAAAEALDGPEGERRGEDVDEGEDERDEEGVVDGAGGLKEGRRVVEDEVDAGPGGRVSGCGGGGEGGERGGGRERGEGREERG